MGDTYLHGVEVVEIDNGSRSISSVTSSIIGIVGTAPDSESATAAAVTIGSGTASLIFTASSTGANGNNLAVRITKPNTASADLAVSLVVSGDVSVVTVSLATDEEKAATSTAAEIKTALDADTDIAALVTVTLSGDGSGVASPVANTYFTGGADEAFPEGEPVLITPSDGAWSRLGDAGSLSRAIDNIWKQFGTPVVVVRVAQTTSDSDEASIAAVAGSSAARPGVFALLDAESVTGFRPRILVAPGFTQEDSVLTNFASVAQSLHAVAIADGSNTTDAEAINYGLGFGSDRVYVVDPRVKVSRSEGIVIEPASSFVAGLIASIDNTEGFWVSPSNHELYGLIGTARAIDFMLGSTSSRANLLNASNIATIIRKNGWRLWGNRTVSSDPKWVFLCVRRTADIINDSIMLNHLWAVDKPINGTYLNDVAEGVNAYMRTLIAEGALIGTQDLSKKVNCCWPNPDLNTAANIADGKVYFDFAFTAPYPAEHMTFRSELNTNGLSTILS